MMMPLIVLASVFNHTDIGELNQLLRFLLLTLSLIVRVLNYILLTRKIFQIKNLPWLSEDLVDVWQLIREHNII